MDNIFVENYKELANAVVLQAVDDYQLSAVKLFELLNETDPVDDKKRKSKRAKLDRLVGLMKSAEVFFKSENLKIYTKIPGNDILVQLNENINKEITKKKEEMEKRRKEQEEYTLGFYSTLDEKIKNLII